ncbi:MAG: hypothetical protein GY746_02790, partial [Gammaproteobacteria bacterium]|nr:hypothetical protein [Gammaproteobacteria bacterium]
MNLCSRTIIGFAFVIASLILVMYSVYHADRKKVDAQEWVEHTYNVISKANQLHKNIIDMETGQRGFLITGKHNFLKPYEDGKKNYKNGINKLYDLISDNPSQQKKIADIDKSINDWLEKAAYPEIKVRNNINYTKKNYQKIAEILSKETGKELMDRIRIQISIFTEYEKELLALRQTRNKKNISQLNTVIIWGTILGLFTGILSMIVTVRNIYHQVGGDPAKVKYFTESISKGEWKTILPENIVEAKGILSSVLKMGKIIK